jgi:hypothetical protein
MEFKNRRYNKHHQTPTYISQGMLDRSFMEGVVISQIEYEIAFGILEERNFESNLLVYMMY